MHIVPQVFLFLKAKSSMQTFVTVCRSGIGISFFKRLQIVLFSTSAIFLLAPGSWKALQKQYAAIRIPAEHFSVPEDNFCFLSHHWEILRIPFIHTVTPGRQMAAIRAFFFFSFWFYIYEQFFVCNFMSEIMQIRIRQELESLLTVQKIKVRLHDSASLPVGFGNEFSFSTSCLLNLLSEGPLESAGISQVFPFLIAPSIRPSAHKTPILRGVTFHTRPPCNL